MGIDINRFRFRAWDKSFRRMRYNIFFFWKENEITVYELEEDGSKYYLPNSHIVLEQCTGLKDKNGKLIYEGDILATSNTNQNNNLDTWDKNALGYTAVIWDNELSCFSGSNWTWEKIGYESVYGMKFIEVVGNIRENPELLE